MRRGYVFLWIAALAVSLGAQQAAPPKPTQAQQRPVFRAGTHFVRVDAYPIQDGKIVEDLEAEDFEVLEDGKPQKIDSFDFVKFDTFTPEAARRDPATQREGFDMAADPRNRVFVIFVDMAFSQSAGAFKPTPSVTYIQQPLGNFLDRILGPNDLYGFITSRNSVKDLVLQRRSAVTKSQIADLLRASVIDKDEADNLFQCGTGRLTGEAADALLEKLKARHRADATYSTLESLVAQLGSIRQERKSVILVTDLLPRWGPDKSLLEARGLMLPQVGIRNGRLGTNESSPVSADDSYCAAEFQRLANLDLDPRYRELLREARRQNVAFYPVTPGGLQAPIGLPAVRAAQAATEDFRSLADETDGIAIVNTNDLNAGIKRIADDLAAYYVLGYYTTNTKWDGGIRNIKVRFKANGNPIRARRQYRAPTQEEIDALASGAASTSAPTVGAAAAAKIERETPIQAALTVLERASAARVFAAYPAASGKTLTVVTELSPATLESGKWRDGGNLEIIAASAAGDEIGTARTTLPAGARSVVVPLPLNAGAWPDRLNLRLRGQAGLAADDWVKVGAPSGALIGDPIAYRSAPRAADSPVAAFEFTRNERIRIEWPVLAPIDNRQVRLLDRLGKPFPIDVPLAEDTGGTARLIAQLPLAALRGDYVIELSAAGKGISDRRLVAIRVR